MGAWSESSFGNDTANDWAYDLEEYDDLSFIQETLQAVLEKSEEFLDSEAEEAIAAAEVLAWLRGKPTPVDAYTEKIATWVASHPIQPPPEIIDRALRALDLIEKPESELAELWEDNPEWKASVADLRSRLTN